MTELILIRHGETDWNRELRFQGQVDVPLNATGHEQARRLARRLTEEVVAADHLVSSDLVRTRQTAAPVLGALLPVALWVVLVLYPWVRVRGEGRALMKEQLTRNLLSMAKLTLLLGVVALIKRLA